MVSCWNAWSTGRKPMNPMQTRRYHLDVPPVSGQGESLPHGRALRPGRLAPKVGRGPELVVCRFDGEARTTAALTSPHMVQLYDLSVSEDGRLYYPMELRTRPQHPGPAERAA